MFIKRLISMVLLICLITGVTGCSGTEKGIKQDVKENNTSLHEDNASEQNTSQVTEINADQKTEGPLNPIFSDEKTSLAAEIKWNPVKYEARVKPYQVKEDLSNIENISQFGSFTEEQKALLARNGFVVASSDSEQLFYIYENNEYMKIPSFVTTDSVLQVYHLFFDYSLRTLEQEKLMEPLQQMTGNMLKKSILVFNTVKDQKVKAAALKNIAYFSVAQIALDKALPADIPEAAKKLAESEFALVKAASGINKSNIYGFDLDYSQFKPRGHYTRSEDFEKYFKAMMWYGQVPFPAFKESEVNAELTAQALLIVYCMFSPVDGVSDVELWNKIYEPTVFYTGSADDLTIYHYKDVLVNVFGKEPDIEKLLDAQYSEALAKELKKLPEPEIQAEFSSVSIPSGKQFRFMGQRYIPDSAILQKLVKPIVRPVPKGLDVMGVLGSDRAYDLLMNKYKEGEKWNDYPKKFAEQKSKFTKTPDDKWRSNMYFGWLWTLKGLLKPFAEGYPSFMANKAWEDKSLSTALGSWAELRHNTILYAKGSAAECGGGDEPPVIRSYVEPNIDVYNRLLWLTAYSRKNLSQKEILPAELENKLQHFQDLLQFLINCSIKELKNEELTKEEYYQLLIYGGTLEYLSTSLAGGYKGWYEITSETDRNMALVADVHSIPGACLEAGVGPAHQIFVAVPIGGKIYLTRGAVFSYYEFMSDTRLTDEEWQKMLKENKQPPQPDWTDSFTSGSKEEIPKPENPYSSGC